MPAKSEFFRKVNLLPADEFEASFLGKALRWSLTAGKSIVIMTEFVVTLAFLSRFKLDRDLNDVNEVVLQKQAVVASMAETEKRMRALQERLDVVNKADETTLNAGDELGDLMASTPLDVKYDSVDISRNSIQLIGVAGSEAGFASLLNSVKTSGKWTEVSLGEVEYSQRKGGVLFRLSARAVTNSPATQVVAPTGGEGGEGGL